MNRFIKNSVESHCEITAPISKPTPIAAVLDIKDRYTREHAWRVGRYARRLAERMDLNAKPVENIRLGGLLHDIGKIGLSAKVLNNTCNRLPDDIALKVSMENDGRVVEEVFGHADVSGLEVQADVIVIHFLHILHATQVGEQAQH